MICSGFDRIALKNWAICSKKTYLYVLTVFHSFPELFLSPLFYVIKRANGSQRSSLSRSFLHFDGIDLLSSLFTKERPWANPSFDHKKWANSQPWFFFMALYCSSLLAIALHIFFFLFRKLTQYCAIRAFANFTRAPSLLPILPRIFFFLINQTTLPPSYWSTSVCVGGERGFSCLWLAKEYKMDGQRVFVLR